MLVVFQQRADCVRGLIGARSKMKFALVAVAQMNVQLSPEQPVCLDCPDVMEMYGLTLVAADLHTITVDQEFDVFVFVMEDRRIVLARRLGVVIVVARRFVAVAILMVSRPVVIIVMVVVVHGRSSYVKMCK